jgi:nitroimidazol reductase NimA-like FMN-containing flavoprotein (pyridoxamine 5'-phosphate oxidase superfamily)
MACINLRVSSYVFRVASNNVQVKRVIQNNSGRRKGFLFIMRDMTQKEIMEFIKYYTWGTLIAVEGDKPYAVEISYGTDGEYIYCGSRPGGRMAQCIQANQNVAFKICDSDRSYSRWKAVIIEAKAERLTSRDDILRSVRHIARQRGFNERAYDGVVDRVVNDPEGNSLRIPIKVVSGVTTG